MNTHFAVIHFSGDLDNEHPDEELRGKSPHLAMVAAGPERFCWEALARWTAKNPLRMWETAEVVTRHPSAVKQAPEGRC